MTLFLFALRTRADGRLQGLVLVCPDARYISLATPHAARLRHVVATQAEWLALERDLHPTAPPGRCAASLLLEDLLTARDAVEIQFLHAIATNSDGPPLVATTLDAQLRAQTDSVLP